MNKRAYVAVAAAAAMALSASPASAKGVRYQGKNGQGSSVSLRISPSTARGFTTSVGVLCVSVATGRSLREIYPIAFKAPVQRKGKKFSFLFDGPSSTLVTVTGRVKGSKVTGSLKVQYNKTLGMTSTGLLDIGACSVKTTWSATAK